MLTTMNETVKDKTVLLIGSGSDLDGRAMQKQIDGDSYDIVARINHPFGAPADVGTRTDMVFVRRREWASYYFHGPQMQGCRIVAFRDGVGCDRDYDAAVRAALVPQAAKASTGLCAVHWLLEHGAKSVTVLGFGWRDGAFADAKTYAVTGEVDTNPKFDWPAEHAYIAERVSLI